MRFYAVLALILTTAFVACDEATEPHGGLSFSKMEIEHYWQGFKIPTSKLEIRGDGTATAYESFFSGPGSLRSASTTLTRGQQARIAELFENFANYDSYYEPEHRITDQDFRWTILIYDGVPDTVSVYMLSSADVPDGLALLINELESLWVSILGEE